MSKSEKITLVGGPGDGLEVEVKADWTALAWKPTEEVERITARTMGRPLNVHDPITYVRSRRTRNLFIYQP